MSDSPLTDRRIWVRILYMLFFWMAYAVAEFLLGVVAVFQALVTLFTGETNDAMHRFGKNLSAYIASILEFQTFNSEELVFPFADWPDIPPTSTPWTPEQADEPAQPTPPPASNRPDAETPVAEAQVADAEVADAEIAEAEVIDEPETVAEVRAVEDVSPERDPQTRDQEPPRQ